MDLPNANSSDSTWQGLWSPVGEQKGQLVAFCSRVTNYS